MCVLGWNHFIGLQNLDTTHIQNTNTNKSRLAPGNYIMSDSNKYNIKPFQSFSEMSLPEHGHLTSVLLEITHDQFM